MDAKRQALGALKAYSRFRAGQSRQLPRLALHDGPGSAAVYYLAPAESNPSGGVRVIYRHVDELNKMGIPAAVVHPRHGFRCSWFENSTRVIAFNELQLRATDLLVVPEFYALGFASLPAGARVVVFNQGPHHTFDLITPDPGRPGWPYTDIARLEALLTVSQDGADLLRMAFPDTPVGTARNVIDEAIFHPSEESRIHRISYVPSRRPEELAQLLNLLNARQEIRSRSWNLLPLHGLTERNMADALRSSALFLSLSDRDGFGLPPAEAMACGSYVVGYHGGGGQEFFDPAFSTPVSSTTELLAALLDSMNRTDGWRRERGEKASARILGHYTAEGLQSDLSAFYGGLL
jgi:hypothetical protein